MQNWFRRFDDWLERKNREATSTTVSYTSPSTFGVSIESEPLVEDTFDWKVREMVVKRLAEQGAREDHKQHITDHAKAFEAFFCHATVAGGILVFAIPSGEYSINLAFFQTMTLAPGQYPDAMGKNRLIAYDKVKWRPTREGEYKGYHDDRYTRYVSIAASTPARDDALTFTGVPLRVTVPHGRGPELHAILIKAIASYRK